MKTSKKKLKTKKKSAKKRKSSRHPFKWLKYDGRNVRIDVDIAPLLSNMWELGIRTGSTCQASCCYSCKHDWKVAKQKDGTELHTHPKTDHCYDHVWITFEDVASYERFLNAVAVYEPWRKDDSAPPSMYELMCETKKSWGKSPYYTGNNDRWEVNFYPDNDGVIGHWKRHTTNGKRDGFNMWCEDGCKKNDFRVSVQLHFPRKHLALVSERVAAAAKEQVR